MSNLQSLNLNSTQVSEETNLMLRKALPDLRECDVTYTDAWWRNNDRCDAYLKRRKGDVCLFCSLDLDRSLVPMWSEADVIVSWRRTRERRIFSIVSASRGYGIARDYLESPHRKRKLAQDPVAPLWRKTWTLEASIRINPLPGATNPLTAPGRGGWPWVQYAWTPCSVLVLFFFKMLFRDFITGSALWRNNARLSSCARSFVVRVFVFALKKQQNCNETVWRARRGPSAAKACDVSKTLFEKYIFMCNCDVILTWSDWNRTGGALQRRAFFIVKVNLYDIRIYSKKLVHLDRCCGGDDGECVLI